MNQETKVFVGLRLFFSVCFGISLLCVVTVYYPLAGMILFLMGLTFLVSKGGAGASNKFGVLLFLLSLLIHLGLWQLLLPPSSRILRSSMKQPRNLPKGISAFKMTGIFKGGAIKPAW